MEKQKKESNIHFRVDRETKSMLREAADAHHLSMSEFILRQSLNDEFIEINFEQVDRISFLFANISNNINQIARALNIIKQQETADPDAISQIADLFQDTIHIFNEHKSAMNESVQQLYQLSSKNKKRKKSKEEQDGND